MSGRENYLVGLDLGTSAIKGILLSADGAVLSKGNEPMAYNRQDGGRIEFDTADFYGRVARIVRGLVRAVPASGRVAGVGMASASGNTLLIDGDGQPLIPAVSWLDARVTDEIEQVFGSLDSNEVFRLVGWRPNKGFPLAHLAWLRCHEPRLLDDAARVCMTTDYLNFRLTGKWGIDRSTATTFYLQNQIAGGWHAPFLAALGIPESKLPAIHPSQGEFIYYT